MPRFGKRSYSTRFARRLRSTMTDLELRLWAVLRHDFPQKFRRQEPLGPYIADFVCYSHRLVVEVDGAQHVDSEYDTGATGTSPRSGSGCSGCGTTT